MSGGCFQAMKAAPNIMMTVRNKKIPMNQTSNKPAKGASHAGWSLLQPA